MYWFLIIYCILLVLNIWLFFVLPKKPSSEKITFFLKIIGIYTFIFGVLAQSGLLKEIEPLAKDMTSGDLLKFLRGNFTALSFMFSADSIALSPDKSEISVYYSLEFPILMISILLKFIFTIFYLLFVLPMSYLGYAIVTVPVNAIMTSGQDISFSIDDSTVTIKELVTKNEVAVKNFLIAIPSFIFSFVSTLKKHYSLSELVLKLISKLRYWLSLHRNVSKAIFYFVQIIIVIVLLLQLSLATSIGFAYEEKKLGEILGVIILNIFIISGLVWLLIIVNKKRKEILSQDTTNK